MLIAVFTLTCLPMAVEAVVVVCASSVSLLWSERCGKPAVYVGVHMFSGSFGPISLISRDGREDQAIACGDFQSLERLTKDKF